MIECGMPKDERPLRPETLSLTIQGGMLEALGINMYTSIGKCLVEFVANGYDSESRSTRISIPFAEIDLDRRRIRADAKNAVATGKRDRFTVLLEPLADNIVITIEDDGHGMDAWSIQDKFLPLNRNRRLDDSNQPTVVKSETGSRHVMGRKGLGKLAGFGAAEVVEIWSKRKGDVYATTFVMDYNRIKEASRLHDVEFIPSYIEGLASETHGTKITLRRLRCDAIKAKPETIVSTIAENFFGIDEADFKIELNDEVVRLDEVEYEFAYPDAGLTKATVDLGDLGAMTIDYIVKFRARQGDQNPAEAPSGRKLGSLPANKRGARIYCNKRLAVGPSLLDLHSGVHNFQAQDYMECVVHADELDRHAIDFVNTNRSDLRRDNEVVDKLITTVSELMKKALAAHYKFRDERVTRQVEEDAFTKPVLRILETLPKKSQTSAKKILRTFARNEGIHSDSFREIAPLLIQSMNAGDVLVKLIEIGHDPKDVAAVAQSLHQLALVEQRDVLKVYRGRREGFAALQKLIERGENNWQESPFFEKELHALLKKNPWLIRPEYSRYFTSDKPMGHVADMLSMQLRIDSHAAANAVADPNKRPDLVFVLVEGNEPQSVVVIEFKSPNIPLDIDHFTQLQGYLAQVRRIVGSEFQKQCTLKGFLIGAMPAHDTKAEKQVTLLDGLANKRDAEIEVLGLRAMLSKAQKTHIDIIEALERDEEAEEGAV